MKIFKSTKRKLKKISCGIALFVFTTNITLVGATSALPGEPKDVHIASADHMVISEVQIGQIGNADNEFVELYNPTTSSVDLSELSLKLHIRNSSGTDNNKTLTFINKEIPSNGFFLIVPNNVYGLSIHADATYSTSGNMLVVNGGVYISASTTAGIGVIDKVGWGTQPAGGYEGTVFNPSILNGQSIERANGVDTDNNSVDFKLTTTPNPQNSYSPAPVVTVNSLRTNNTKPIITGTIDDPEAAISIKIGSNEYPAINNGATWETNITSALAEGIYDVQVTAIDEGGNIGNDTTADELEVDLTGPEINIVLSSEYISLDNPTVTISYDLSETADVEMNIYATGSDESLKSFSDSGVTEGDETWDGTREGETEILDSGGYDVEIQATDELGNVSSKIAQIKIDMEAPDATSDSIVNTSNPTKNNNPEVIGKYSINSGVEKVVVVFDKDGQKYEKEAVLDEDNGTYSTRKEDAFITIILEEGKEVISNLVTLPDGTYKVSAVSYDAAGNSAIENIKDADALVIDTIAPSVPTGLKTVSKMPSSISISWTANTEKDLLGYRVYWGTKEGEYKNIEDVGISTSYTLKGLTSSTTYYFKVLAYDRASNESLLSSSLEEKTSAIVTSTASTDSDTQDDTKSSPKEENKGVVESAQAASPENVNKDEQKDDQSKNEQSAQTKGRNNLFLLSILLLVFGVSGYYYYSLNPEKFKNLKFPKLPGIK